MPQVSFELQGHRGARGLKPENTLPSFEAALDAGVASIETDVHLTADGVPILYHDEKLTDRVCRPVPGSTPSRALQEGPWVSSLTLVELRGYLADKNPDPRRFPDQDAAVTPLAALVAERAGVHPYAIPTVADLFAFARAYAGRLGKQAGKTRSQQGKAARARFDLELKRVPFLPEAIGDVFDGTRAGLLETRLVEVIRASKILERTLVRSFDHRAVRAIKKLEPALAAGLLIAATAPVSPARLVRQANADFYAPDYLFIDPQVIRQAHAQGIRVIPWTVNDPHDWEKLIAWGIDGLTTDYPDRLATWLLTHGIK